MSQETNAREHDDEATCFEDQPVELQLLYVETLVRQGLNPEAMGLPSLESLKQRQQAEG